MLGSQPLLADPMEARTMSLAVKTTLVTTVAAILAALLFLSPVGISRAQDDGPPADAQAPAEPDADHRPSRPGAEEREARAVELLEAFAAELGVTSDEVVDAAKAVAIDQVEQRVADGALDRDRADALIERIESAELGDLLRRGLGFGPWHGPPGHRDGPGPRGWRGGDAPADPVD